MPLPPPPAAALISTGKPRARGRLEERAVLLAGAVIARHQRHARLRHQGLGAILGAHRLDHLGRRPDEGEPAPAQARANAGFSERKP